MENFDVEVAWRGMTAQGAKLNDWEAGFVQSVSRNLQRYGSNVRALSIGQINCIKRWWDRQNAPVVAPREIPVPQLVGLFDTAKQNIKRPKITFRLPIGTLRFSLAGPKSKYPGCLQVTDGGSYGNNLWYGRVTVDGMFQPSAKSTPAIETLIRDFTANPATIAGEYGIQTGACCFCDRPLDDPKSVAVGYGPVCAKNYGLPWGGKVRGRK